MPTAAVARFEAAAGDLLEELGYTRGAASPSQGDLRGATRVRETYVDRARTRGRPLPDAWTRRAA